MSSQWSSFCDEVTGTAGSPAAETSSSPSETSSSAAMAAAGRVGTGAGLLSSAAILSLWTVVVALAFARMLV